MRKGYWHSANSLNLSKSVNDIKFEKSRLISFLKFLKIFYLNLEFLLLGQEKMHLF